MKNAHGSLESLVKYLQAHGNPNVHLKGSRVTVENVKHDDLKLLLHKFLHHEHLDDYKVHSQPGFIEIIPATSENKKAHQKDSKGRGPTSSETVPYFFPGS